MLKVLFLLVISFSSIFAGWFSSSYSENHNVGDATVRLIVDSNKVLFEDSKRVYDLQERKARGIQLFSFIKEYGNKKGFKSFSIENEYLSQSSGFPIDNTDDIVRYCNLGEEYTSFCSAGNKGILLQKTKYNMNIVFYTDNSGSFSI